MLISFWKCNWGAPSFVVDQAGKGLLGRPVRDYRWLNSQTLDEAWPSPDAEETLRRAQRASLITLLDCVWGYTQCPIDEATSNLMSLVTKRGILRPLVLYFGCKQGPGIFQGLADIVFGNLRDKNDDHKWALSNNLIRDLQWA